MKNRWAEQTVEAKTLFTTASLTRFLLLQGGGSGMSEEKEGVCPVSGEPRGRAGEPEQDPDRGAESPEGPLLPQGRVAAAAAGWRGSGSSSSAGRDSRTKPALTAFVFLAQSSEPKTAEALVRIASSLHVETQVSYALCLRVFVHGRRRRRRKRRRFPRCRLGESGSGFGLPAGSSEVRRTHAGPPAAAPWQRHRVYLTTSPGWWMLQQSSHTALPKTFLLCGDLTGPSELQIFYPNLYISSQFLWTRTSGTTLTLGANVAGDAAFRSSKAPACISPFYAFT